jgi:NMD protein affecting ribosome stability and mRNA decay
MATFKTFGPLIESLCPQCDYQLTAATIAHGDEALPEKGDASVCLNCGQLLIYESDLTLRRARVEELRELMQDADAWATIEKAQIIIRERGPLPKVKA